MNHLGGQKKMNELRARVECLMVWDKMQGEGLF